MQTPKFSNMKNIDHELQSLCQTTPGLWRIHVQQSI